MAVTVEQVVAEIEIGRGDYRTLADGVADRMVFRLDDCITPEDIAAIVREAASAGEAQHACQIRPQSDPHLPPQATRQDAGLASHVLPLALLSALLVGAVAGSLLTIAARPSQRSPAPAGSHADDVQGWFRDLVRRANLHRDPACAAYLQGLVAESSRCNLGREIAGAGARVAASDKPSPFEVWRNG